VAFQDTSSFTRWTKSDNPQSEQSGSRVLFHSSWACQVWAAVLPSQPQPLSLPLDCISHTVSYFLRLQNFGLKQPWIAIPVALRVIYRDKFVRGPFHLGVFSYPVAILAVLWIAFISIVFVLPQANPVDSQTLNYAIVAVGIVVTYSVGELTPAEFSMRQN
jgi:hypothetical protein